MPLLPVLAIIAVGLAFTMLLAEFIARRVSSVYEDHDEEMDD